MAIASESVGRSVGKATGAVGRTDCRAGGRETRRIRMALTHIILEYERTNVVMCIDEENDAEMAI